MVTFLNHHQKKRIHSLQKKLWTKGPIGPKARSILVPPMPGSLKCQKALWALGGPIAEMPNANRNCCWWGDLLGWGECRWEWNWVEGGHSRPWWGWNKVYPLWCAMWPDTKASSLYQQSSLCKLEEAHCGVSVLPRGRGRTSHSPEEPPIATAAPVGCSTAA